MGSIGKMLLIGLVRKCFSFGIMGLIFVGLIRSLWRLVLCIEGMLLLAKLLHR